MGSTGTDVMSSDERSRERRGRWGCREWRAGRRAGRRLRTAFAACGAAVATLAAVAGAPVAVAEPAARGEAAPGSIVSSSPVSSSPLIPGAASTTRVVYTTRAADGAGRVSGGLVFAPRGVVPVGGWPVVSYAHGTVGLADACAPSTTGYGPEESAYINGWLEKGWAVVATDYAGLGTEGELAYLDGEAAANNVIDMVSAGRNLDPRLSRTWIAAGLSQGAHATMFTARRATERGAGLDYRGAIPMGLPAGLEQLFRVGGPDLPDLGLRGATKFSLFILSGIADARPDLDVDSYLTPRGRELVRAARSVCSVDFDVTGVTNKDILARPLAPIADGFDDYLAVPRSGYDRPLLLVQGAQDRVTPMPMSLYTLSGLRASGTDVEYVVIEGGDHMSTPEASLDRGLAFAERVTR